MCGLYLESDSVACEECKKAATERRKVTDNYKNLEYKEVPINEYYL